MPERSVIVAPDKFKGSLTAAEVARHVAAGLRKRAPGIPVITMPVSDGGDGFVDALVAAGYERRAARVDGPTGEPVDASHAVRDGVGIVELAEASGLVRLPGGRSAPMTASSYGTGQVMRAALDAGCRTLIVGLGGSASTDGGAGLVQALGVRLLDEHGREIERGGAALRDLASIDLSGLAPALDEATIIAAADVDNPLTGPHGAAAVYGPQKGASPDQVAELDRALGHWAEVVTASTDTPGSGAAGGVGFALFALLGATMRPGIDLIMELTDFPRRVRDARLVITGEGRLDEQTLHGKAPAGVAIAAQRANVPVVAVAGHSTLDQGRLDSIGIEAVYALTDIEPDRERCMSNAGPLLERLAERLAADRLI